MRACFQGVFSDTQIKYDAKIYGQGILVGRECR